MQDHGILQDIRDLLALGKPSREVIEMGYAPGSVYKAQRQLRKRVVSTPYSSNALTEATGVAPDEPSTDRGLERGGRLETQLRAWMDQVDEPPVNPGGCQSRPVA